MPDAAVSTPARDRLAVALDVPDLAAADALIARLGAVPGWLKIGFQLFAAAGPAAIERARRDARVFLDLKFHDIPNTVASGVQAATAHGVSMLTVHAAGGSEMLRAAREAASEAAERRGVERPLVVAVTVLTSLSAADLKEIGVAADAVEDQVARMVDLAVAAGLDGVVASPQEAAAIRARTGADFRIVTPGVRPASWPGDDQARTAGAAAAIEAGADLLVVGRPIVRADVPERAARELVSEIEQGLVRRGS
jgi:orotidine-5'-phosphate decarboxylase